jgi:hypothetical protein
MRLPRTNVVRGGIASARPLALVRDANAHAHFGTGVQPSANVLCILSKAAQCLPICLTGNVPACVACAGPGILSCL